MSLFDHARAARILGDAFGDQIGPDPTDRAAVIASISNAYHAAADRMEEEAKAEIRAIGGGCTLDHSVLNKGQRCPACQS